MLLFLASAVFCSQAAPAATASPPSGTDVARTSNVEWSNPVWTNDGTGEVTTLPNDSVDSLRLPSTSIVILGQLEEIGGLHRLPHRE